MLFTALLLSGCRLEIRDPQTFLTAYRKAAETASTAGNYTMSSMLATPEYLAGARFRGESAPSKAVFDSLRQLYQGSLYLAFSVAPLSEGASPGAHTDVVGEELSKGRSAFAEGLNMMQNGLSQLCYLELSDGSKVFPSTYSFDRGWGLRKDVNFLFAFPKTWNGKAVDPAKARFVIQDFGLNIGNIRHAIKSPPRMNLKV